MMPMMIYSLVRCEPLLAFNSPYAPTELRRLGKGEARSCVAGVPKARFDGHVFCMKLHTKKLTW
jgi:hypothetical protein